MTALPRLSKLNSSDLEKKGISVTKIKSSSNKVLVYFLVGFLLVGVGVMVYLLIQLQPFKNLFPGKDKKPGSCLVLEEKYCSLAEPIYEDGKLIFVGFKLPKKTPVFAPFAGSLSNTPRFTFKEKDSDTVYEGSTIKSEDVVNVSDKEVSEKYFSAIYFDNNYSEKPQSAKVEEGTIVGGLSIQRINTYGDYNLLLFWSEVDQQRGTQEINEQGLKRLFSL